MFLITIKPYADSSKRTQETLDLREFQRDYPKIAALWEPGLTYFRVTVETDVDIIEVKSVRPGFSEVNPL